MKNNSCLTFLTTCYFDPEIGRFTSKDRFKGFENRPASQNPYTYCENDPVNRVDPNGLISWSAAKVVLAVLGVVLTFLALAVTSEAWATALYAAGVFATAASIAFDIYDWYNGDESTPEMLFNVGCGLASFDQVPIIL